jgi:DtxR family Mn-dependent transcriptional regulator
MTSISKEDYLSTIFKHRDDEGEIKPNVIAEWLQISGPAVTDMLKKLAKDDFIIYKPYRGVRFTNHGEDLAKRLVRRHRIWEIFLHQIVGMSWDKVHEEAERLEHHSSDELIDRLEEMLDFPSFDPHGDPIPGKDGVMPELRDLKPLSRIGLNTPVIVQQVSSYDGKFLSYIHSIGIQLNVVLKILEKRDFDKSLLLETNGKKESISSMVADNIFVSMEY